MNFPATSAFLETLNPEFDTLFDPTPDSEVVSCQIWLETGSQHESALAGSGISHLLEHMVFKGTDHFSGSALAQEVQAAGGQWNAYTSFDRTVYYIDGPAQSLDLFLSALIEMVFRPTLPLDEFEKEKEVIRREIAMGLDDPDSVASQHLFRTFFQRDHRRHPIIGHLDLFNALTHHDLTTYHGARYRPHLAFLALSGGFDPAQARTIVERELAKGLRPPAAFPVSCPLEPTQLGPRRASRTFPTTTTTVNLAWQIPALDHPDLPALELLSSVLGGNRTSPLYRIIREEKNLAYHIGASTWSPSDGPGLFSVSAECDPENTSLVESEVFTQIQQLAGADLTKPLARAIRQTTTSQFKTLTTASGRASDLASNWHESRDLDFTRTFIEKISAVTPADLRRVLTTYLTPDHLTVTTLVPDSFTPSQKSHTAKNQPSEIIQHTLSNGLRVLLQRDPTIPLVYSRTAVVAGSLSESTQTAGLNSLLASILRKGTTSRDTLTIEETLDDLGAKIGTSAGHNTFSLSSSCLSEDLPILSDLLGEIIREPSLPSDALNRERKAMLAQLDELLLDPTSLAFRELRHQLWLGKGYSVPRSGTHESLKALDRLTLSAQHSRHFVSQNMVTAFFGDLDPDHTLELLEKSLGQLPTGSPISIPAPIPTQPGETHLTLEKEQAVLAIGFPALPHHDPRIFALELLDSYCSDMAGPLFTRIREDHGLAYFVGSNLFLGLNTGSLTFYLGTSPEQLNFARQELTEEISKLFHEGIPAEALDRTKANLLAQKALQNQSPSARANIACIESLLNRPLLTPAQLREHYLAVTPDQIHALTAELLDPAHAFTVTVSPSK